MTPNYPNRAEIELAHIRTAVAGLPTSLRHRILNRCDKLSVLYRRQQQSIPEADDRTPRQQQEQVAGQYNTAQRIVAALLSGRTLSQRDSQEFKTTAFHSRIADARRILSRQGYTLRSRYTTDAETLAGRAFKLYWIDNTQNI
jgi:hypothetical protein